MNDKIYQGKKAAYTTLGCKLNFAETATFEKMLTNLGVQTAEKGEQADLCIINTCSVTEVADHKCRQIIHRTVRQHPGAFIVVTGCYAQLKPMQVAAIEGVDLVLGANEKANLITLLAQRWNGEKNQQALHEHLTVPTRDINTFAPSCARGNRTRYFLKVQDGCDYFCTYCTIPFARGFSRSPSIASIVAQARQVAEEGGKEIVLTGVNIGHFGHHTGEKFIDLLRALDEVEGIARYRISSIEPDLLLDEVIDFCANSRAFMPHFHIPLQSGSDHVLALMHRRYDTALYARKVERIMTLMPHAFIGVDVMVGTRGETQDDFQQSLRFLSDLPVAQLHVFPYSERPGTAALRIPLVVSDKEKDERVDALLTLSKQKTDDFYLRHQDQQRTVLFEKAQKHRAMTGFTDNYIRVQLPPRASSPELDNQLRTVTLGDWNSQHNALIAFL